MKGLQFQIIIALLACHDALVSGFAIFSTTIAETPTSTTPPSTESVTTTVKDPFAEVVPSISVNTKDVVTKVAVTGATGKTGSLVVQELLNRGVPKVIAVVRNMTKAQNIFDDDDDRLEIVECNLVDESDISTVFTADLDATIWCATGFANDAPPKVVPSPSSTKALGFWDKIKAAVGMQPEPVKPVEEAPPAAMPPTPGRSIDVIGLPAIAAALKQAKADASPSNDKEGPTLPKVVMCSSSGVTRPIWSEAKKEMYRGAADIPIVRLNPFSILDRKRESEEALRQSGIEYCIVRPCGLNDEWPAGSRPVFSQGDVAVGRANRKDVACVLVDVLSAPEATGKTFEMVALAGYPKPVSIGPALARLRKDESPTTENSEDDDAVLAATFSIMQQLLPGEKQDSAGLAMGQTYEQLDKGETGRLGTRGSEDAEAAAPKPTS